MRADFVGWRMNAGYHQDRTTGYGRFGYELHSALQRAGVVDYGPIGVNEEFSAVPNVGTAPVAFYAATPPHVVGWSEGQLAALFTMWEFSEIPVGFRENVPDFDRIFVPSRQNVELFSHFHPDVRYVPLAVGEEWTYRPRTDPNETGRFEFLTGGAGPRKGCNEVIQAFNTVFAAWKPSWGPEPHLTVRASNIFEPDTLVTTPGVRCDLRIDKPAPVGRVTQLRRTLTQEAEIELYARSHCFVSGSKGEGWGFMPHQAIAQGMPTILGRAHGHAAFAHYGLPIDTHLQKPTIHTHWGAAGEEWAPDFDQMCESILDVYRNWDRSAMVARAQAEAIALEFSWDRTAQILLDNLPELERPMLEGDLPWHSMPQRLYETRVVRHSTWTVNGRHSTFDPGITYWIPWADKLLLAERGDLTQDCVSPREVGIDARMKPADLVERCPHCEQRYGSDTSLLRLRETV